MSRLQRYEMVQDYVGASMEKDDYGDWYGADEVDKEMKATASQVIDVAAKLARGDIFTNLQHKCDTQNTIATGVLRVYLDQLRSEHCKMAVTLRDAVVKEARLAMSKLQRYEHVSDYIGARMEKDDYGDWCDADEVDDELKRMGLLLKAAHHLLMAATGPDGGPTNWNDTRQAWMDRAKEFFPKLEATGDECGH